MKMGKKVREYKSGDFIFAKVKGYPAWPARVQRMNGKKYFVYFYGTGETANLPPNMIFDYAENKDKFLTKSVKRRDFNDGVKQIEYDFANNVPLEQVIGIVPVVEEAVNDTANETVDESNTDTTAADETMAEENITQNDTGIEDSDDTGTLVIDEGKPGKGRKSTAKTPAKDTLKVKEPKTPRGRPRKEEESKEEVKEEDRKEEELVSRSGRKIRPKRYIDEHTEENTTLPSPAPKKRRGNSPVEKEREIKEKGPKEKEKDKEKNIKHFNAVTQAELEDLKEPFTPDDPDKENVIIAYLPAGEYIGIKLFQSRPTNFKNDAAKLQWDKQAASNALTLKMQLEKGHITAQSVLALLVMDLNLTDEEKATLDKERETEEKKSRVQFLKTEMKLIELDAKIKTCLCLEKADTELCLKLLDELIELDIKPLMLLKHPTTLETIKRMRAYVGNTPSWELSEHAALLFSQHAHKIRKQADTVYNNLKGLFDTPDNLSFWEFFTERVAQFKKATSKLTSDELLELVHEPLEMSLPTSHTMKASVEAANEEEQKEEEEVKKNKPTPAKTKKAQNNTPSKPPLKRQTSRKQLDEKEKEQTNTEVKIETNSKEQNEELSKEKEIKENNDKDVKENDKEEKEVKEKKEKKKETKESKEQKEIDEKDSAEERENETKEEISEKTEGNMNDSKKESTSEEEKKESSKETEKEKSTEKEKNTDKEKSTEKSEKEDKEKDKSEDEPRAKRSRETKKTDPPPRSPTKRKSKF